MPFRFADVPDQKAALTIIGKLIAKGAVDPKVVKAARQITSDCPARDDLCELEAIFRAVKEGDPRIPGLAKGLRYVSDPRSHDWYQGANRMLAECEDGACAADCDEHTVLVGSLCAAIGFRVGARAYGKPRTSNYQHVYAVTQVPKLGPVPRGYTGHGMDTTVADAYVGWQPENGRIMTIWLD